MKTRFGIRANLIANPWGRHLYSARFSQKIRFGGSMRRFSVYVCAVVFSCIAVSASARQYVITGAGQGAGSTNFKSAIPGAGGSVLYDLPAIGVVIATSDDSNFAAKMSKVSGVQFATPDMDVQWISPKEQAFEAVVPETQSLNSEPYAAYQWNIPQIRANVAAANGNRGAGAVVAVLDAGCNMNHVDIKPNILTGFAASFVPGQGAQTVTAGFNHGTHVSGIIAAAINNTGTQGVAPSAKIIPVKVLSEVTGGGNFGWLIAGLDYVASLNRSGAIRVDVVNMSLGATFDRVNQGGDGAGPLIAALNRAMNAAAQAGILCISAAGNEEVDLNSRVWSIPAQSGNGIAVSATGPVGLANFDRLASYSNWGRSVVDVAGPGGDFTLYPASNYVFDMVIAPGAGTGTTGYYFAAGTSMAAPAASGVAALIVGKYGHMSPAQLKSRLAQSAVNIGPSAFFGAGRIDALNATSAP
jgi:subtilisin family serine protease